MLLWGGAERLSGVWPSSSGSRGPCGRAAWGSLRKCVCVCVCCASKSCAVHGLVVLNMITDFALPIKVPATCPGGAAMQTLP
eukprot:scaffold112731_cov15-Tisochrysis_lutea.AAC.2